MFTVDGAVGISNGTSGHGDAGRARLRAGRMPSERGRPASVISATLHLPSAIASAACATWMRYDEPPVSVESTCRSLQAHVVDHRQRAEPGRVAGAEVAVDVVLREPRVLERALRDLGVQLRDRLVGALRVGCSYAPTM